MVHGSRDDAEALREGIAEVLATMGLRLSPEKTLITHIDQGLDFLGWHIQRHRKRGTRRCYVYTYPSRKAVTAAMGKVKAIRRRTATGLPLDDLLIQMNRMLAGWCMHFRPGVSSATFQYLSSYVWGQVMKWLRCKHRRISRKDLRHRYCGAVGGQPGRKGRCSIPARCARRATATGEPSSRPHGQLQDEDIITNKTGLRSARCRESGTPGAGSGPGKRLDRKTRPRLGPTSPPAVLPDHP